MHALTQTGGGVDATGIKVNADTLVHERATLFISPAIPSRSTNFRCSLRCHVTHTHSLSLGLGTSEGGVGCNPQGFSGDFGRKGAKFGILLGPEVVINNKGIKTNNTHIFCPTTNVR